ncbi:MAG TPA: RNA methyltransferase [Gemmataceae bacterium]|nr:RNA methyltransferase [Gemmataceae bacterium]
MALANCRVVLVRPRIAANVGAVARVMRNFGLSELVLVEPEAALDDPRGRLLATHAEDILDRARAVPDLGAAVADCHLLAGTSARMGGLFRRQSTGTPEAISPQLLPALAAGRVALVFGPESSGLSNEEVARCHYLIHIPTDERHPALNLAQAVAICLYELRRAWLAAVEPPAPVEAPASFAAQEQMFARLREALEQIHFLYGAKADALMHGLRHLIGRARPTEMEVKLLLGLARQIRWLVAHGSGERGASAP